MQCRTVGLDEAWKEINEIYGWFWKKLLGVAEMELGKQQEKEEDVEGNKILAESYRYGHSRPGKTVL